MSSKHFGSTRHRAINSRMAARTNYSQTAKLWETEFLPTNLGSCLPDRKFPSAGSLKRSRTICATALHPSQPGRATLRAKVAGWLCLEWLTRGCKESQFCRHKRTILECIASRREPPWSSVSLCLCLCALSCRKTCRSNRRRPPKRTSMAEKWPLKSKTSRLRDHDATHNAKSFVEYGRTHFRRPHEPRAAGKHRQNPKLNGGCSGRRKPAARKGKEKGCELFNSNPSSASEDALPLPPLPVAASTAWELRAAHGRLGLGKVLI